VRRLLKASPAAAARCSVVRAHAAMLQITRALGAMPPLYSYAAGRRRLRFIILASALLFALAFFLLGDVSAPFSSVTFRPPGWTRKRPAGNASSHGQQHPIDELIEEANSRFRGLLSKRSYTVSQAASRYRERRGRHPPPGFEAWFAQAQKDGAVIVEEFFDRIHHDINPFWGLNPKDLRAQATVQPQVIRVRNGKADFVTDDPNRQPWIQHWTELVKDMMPHLPDLDMVINFMDETRILVPWEKIAEYMKAEQANRKLIDPKAATTAYSGLKDVEGEKAPYDPGWISGDAPKFWDYLRAACPPDSPSRNVAALPSFNVSIEYPTEPMPFTFKGFIQNFTQAQDPCLQPHLRGMHGTFIESVSMSTTRSLLPMFAGSKLPQNNEILIPGAMYLSDREFYNGGETHGPNWSYKRNGLIWRGTASGGRNKEDTWWHFHRHRFVQMMNGTTVGAMEAGNEARGPTFRLLPKERYSLPSQLQGKLGEWLSSFSDVAFVNLECHPYAEEEVGTGADKHMEMRRTCPYSSPYMAIQPGKPMKEQYEYKYLPDVDGNSFSARWRAFLQSTSMPLKATIYSEWHDDRIIPWVHFVPFDNSYGDIYAIMDYFLDGRDKAAEIIATEGKKWVEQVYRREDMKLYVWRLLLEYARVVDDKRDTLAFIEDLK